MVLLPSLRVTGSLALLLAIALAAVPGEAAGRKSSGRRHYRVATFRADATPALGEPLIWTDPTKQVLDPLWLKGVLIDDGQTRYVLCSLDWCGVGGSLHRLFRETIAAAAGASADHVELNVIHQHTAPIADGDAYALLRKLPDPPLILSQTFVDGLMNRLTVAVKDAAARLQPFDEIGTGMARVEKVASIRRLMVDGKEVTRYSTSGKDPAMAALPEGPIDPMIRVVTLARDKKPIVRLFYYATHPQTFCCDNRVSGDFVNMARESFEKKDGAFEIYFTGCAGDVTVGKYNDKKPERRPELAERLESGMTQAASATRYAPVNGIKWRTATVRLPSQDPAPFEAILKNPAGHSGQELYRAAMKVSYAQRKEPLEVTLMEIGNVRILSLPGEPMLEFQKYAQRIDPRQFIAVAGYGDMAPSYLCTDEAYREGGYETIASNVTTGTEALLKSTIATLLGKPAGK